MPGIVAGDQKRHRLAGELDALAFAGRRMIGLCRHLILRGSCACIEARVQLCHPLPRKVVKHVPKLLQNVAEMDRQPASAIYKFGPFALDAETGLLFRGASRRCLASAPSRCCACCWSARGVPVTKDALIEAAWPGLAVEDSNLTVQIAALRRVLEQDGGDGWIETLPRRGYRYVGPPVTRTDDGASDSATSASAAGLPEKPSIAVLPFEHSRRSRPGSPMAWSTTSSPGLSRIKWLFVIARNSSFVCRGRAADVKQVGRDLGVRYVLQGSVRRSADRVRINVQLVDALTAPMSGPSATIAP